jgi:hypothetical protein
MMSKRLAVAVGLIGAILCGCQKGGDDAGNSTAIASQPVNSLGTPEPKQLATLCTAAETQEQLRMLVGASIKAGIAQGAQLGIYQGDMGLLRWGAASAVADSVDQIEFTRTTLSDASANGRGVTCVTGMTIKDDPGGEVLPRISFQMEQALEGGPPVVSVSRPMEIQAAIPILASGIARVKQAADARSMPVDEADVAGGDDGPSDADVERSMAGAYRGMVADCMGDKADIDDAVQNCIDNIEQD